MKPTKILVHGLDGFGWSIDADAQAVRRALNDLGFTIARSPWNANVLHSVWYSQLLSVRALPLRLLMHNVLATVTNDVDPQTDVVVEKLRRWVNVWIVANRSQYKRFEDAGIRVAYQPFYVDEKVFRPLELPKQALAASLGIPFERIKGKYIIGSFQRDTLGSDLSKPKWQKNPDLLISILESLPDKDRWVVLFAGPRRHYVIAESAKRGIPFIYYGKTPTPGVDDITTNICPPDRMAELYNICDVHVITSRSEGGPKAVVESVLCGRPVFSTPVGWAPDFLPQNWLFSTKDEAVGLIRQHMLWIQKCHEKSDVAETRERVLSICNYEVYKQRWFEIYHKYFFWNENASII